VDIINAVAREMGLGIRIELDTWAKVRTEIESGKIDALMGMFNTSQRDKLVDFTIPHFIASYSVFVQKGSVIKSIEDAKGKKILVQKGDLGHDYIQEKHITSSILIRDSIKETLVDLAKGKADCAVASRLQGMIILKNKKIKNIIAVGPPIIQRKYCMAVTEGNGNLLAKLNEGLSIIKTTGEYELIYNKWFGVYENNKWDRTKIIQYIIWIVSPLLLIIFFAFLWSWSLKNKVFKRTKELQESEQKLRGARNYISNIIDSMPSMLIGVNAHGQVIQWNKTTEVNTGIDAAVARGKQISSVLPQMTSLMDKISESIRTRKITIAHEKPLISEDSVRYEDITIYPLISNSAEGAVIRVDDVTEKVQMEELIIQSDKKYKFMAENITDVIWIMNKDLNFTYISPSVYQQRGYSVEEAMKLSLEETVESDSYEKIISHYEKTLSRTRIREEEIFKSFEFELKQRCKDGSLIWTSNNVRILKETAREPESILGISRDITKQKVSEKNRIALEEKLLQAQKMESIGTLAGGIAHDFNNILSPIMGYTEMLIKDVPDNSSLRTSLDEIYTGTLRARDLVRQILTFSRQESSELKPMRMQPVVREALKLIRSTIPTTIDIKQDLSSDCDMIYANPTQILQVVMNLATNAYHAMQETGGELRVGLKEIEFEEHDLVNSDMSPGVYALLSVSDSGIGMDKELTEKMFVPFFTTKEKSKGTGMGLSVVYGIIKSIGGAIRAVSEIGKGTVFYIYIPVIKHSLEKQEIPVPEPIQEGTEKILLVDDEEGIIKMETKMLKHLGYHVTSFTSSIEALKTFKDNPGEFDLVISDMAMPDIPGDKLAYELSKIRQDIPILLCTGFSESMSEEKAVSLGIKGLLIKPVTMNNFSQKIREVLDKK